MSSKTRDLRHQQITEAYVLRRKVEQLEQEATRLRIIEWWKMFWKARPGCGFGDQARVDHGIVETRKGMWDGTTFVCSCGELFPVTGMELSAFCV